VQPRYTAAQLMKRYLANKFMTYFLLKTHSLFFRNQKLTRGKNINRSEKLYFALSHAAAVITIIVLRVNKTNYHRPHSQQRHNWVLMFSGRNFISFNMFRVYIAVIADITKYTNCGIKSITPVTE